MVGDIIKSFSTPPGLFIIILLVIAFLALKKPRHLLLFISLSILSLVLYILSIPATTFILNRWLVDVNTPQLPPEHVKAAILVLAAGASNDENGKPIQPAIDTLERLYVGVKIAKAHPNYILIFSGGYPYNDTSISTAAIMRASAKIMDCKSKIILEEKSRNTDENLKFCAEIVKKLGVKNVVVVTSSYHISRSIVFAYEYMPSDVHIYPYPSGDVFSHKLHFTLSDFLPKMRSFYTTTIRFREIIGLMFVQLSK